MFVFSVDSCLMETGGSQHVLMNECAENEKWISSSQCLFKNIYVYAFSLHLSCEGFCSVQLGFLTLWASGHSSRQQSLTLQQMRSPVKLALLLCHAWLISQEQDELHWLLHFDNPEWETVALSQWTGDTSADCQQIHCTCRRTEHFLLLSHASLQCWGQ